MGWQHVTAIAQILKCKSTRIVKYDIPKLFTYKLHMCRKKGHSIQVVFFDVL